jgi:aconitate hydratase 2/2-methylisocitrate dehydratase
MLLLQRDAAKVLKTQFFLYEADTARLEVAFKSGNEIAKEILESYAKTEFLQNFQVVEEIKVVTYIAGENNRFTFSR